MYVFCALKYILEVEHMLLINLKYLSATNLQNLFSVYFFLFLFTDAVQVKVCRLF